VAQMPVASVKCVSGKSRRNRGPASDHQARRPRTSRC